MHKHPKLTLWVEVALQATIEMLYKKQNTEVCKRKISSYCAFSFIKYIKETYFWCIPAFFGVNSSR